MAPPVVVGNTGTAPRSAVVWLHGLGDTAHGWAALMQQLALPMPHTRFELPTAPERPVGTRLWPLCCAVALVCAVLLPG